MFGSSLYKEGKRLIHFFSNHFRGISSGPRSGLGRAGKVVETEAAPGPVLMEQPVHRGR